MRKIVKKNHIVIAALTVLLGVAGYINFSGNSLNLDDDNTTEATEAAMAYTNPDDIVSVELSMDEMVQPEHIELNSDEEDIGEAVLTSTGTTVTNLVNVKLGREQSRSKIKENYLLIMNDENMDSEAIAKATDAYVKMNEDMEKETEAETVLSAKGYTGVVVSIGEESVDVIICTEELADDERAQIEDVVVRKTGCTVDDIVITTVKE